MGVKAELSVRRVDSKTYFEVLKDVTTKEYYDWRLPFDEKPELHGHLLWHSEKLDGWEVLLCAIINLAAKDYVEAVAYEIRYKRSNLTKKIVEEYLSEWAPEILDGLKARIRHTRYDGLKRLIRNMRMMW